MSLSHVPVYVISGFLGAGKTTLLNRVLKGSHGIRFAVIVNEFGEIGLDGDLIEGSSEDFVKMDNGCLCCALNAELMETVVKLKERDDFDAVLIETTGIADPLPVAWTFFREQFLGCFRFGGILTVADALNFDKMTQKSFEVAMQIERADYLYLSKTTLVPPRQLEALEILLKEINPNARVVHDTDQDIFSLLFDFGGDEKTLSELKNHAHDHSKTFESFAVDISDKKIPLNKIEDFFEALPPEIFRAKAVFQDVASGKNKVAHAVCGRVEIYDTDLKFEKSACVFIGKNFDKEKLKKDFESQVLS